MRKKEHLSSLKALDRAISAPFKSQDDCISWANSVAPLLKFDPDKHSAFLQQASIINIPTLSGNTYGMAARQMVGITKQAIVELEHGLTSGPEKLDTWKRNLGLGVIASLIAAVIWWVAIPYLDAWRHPDQQGSQTSALQKEGAAKRSKVGAPSP